MEKKQHRIVVDRGCVTQIASDLGISRPTVIKALRGTVSTATHARVRLRAIELGGIEVKDI